MKRITLTENEARLVMKCLDIAVRHGGLENAVVVLPVAQSIEAQLTAPAPVHETAAPEPEP